MGLANNRYSRDRLPCAKQRRFGSKRVAEHMAKMTGSIARLCAYCSSDEHAVYHLTKKAGWNVKKSL